MSEATEELTEPQNIYDLFETDDSLEINGVWFEYAFGDFKLAFVGGANQAFQREYAERMKPYAEAEARGMMDPETRRQIQIECYVDHVVKDWRDVIGKNGQKLKFNRKNAIQLFTDLRHLFEMIRGAATNFANYRRIYADGAVGN